ncbi:hypothetical protein J7T55_007799 [Diaporthe amygdali]|uniref:uncharacterized protein n=1 Tax=Phomopsis amygdali TaxID=1214568 RepID=UPI0022FDFF08|nr:uncharacterized protein J7T55_007799 [Diaporthe amygdali]KAJ0107608.1 hypothetical protein J7T55_007799 [Diaporthe amygdali]
MEWAESRTTAQGSSSGSPSTTDESFVEPGKMKLAYFGNEFPADSLGELTRRLQDYSRDRRHYILAKFIHEATLVVREEVASLPGELRLLVPPFTTVFSLAENTPLREGPLGAAVNGMLLCVLQLAAFIGYYERHPDEVFDIRGTDTCLAGLGTGLLSTAAISLSPSLSDTPIAAAEVIRIAFRLGVVVDEVSRNLEPRPLDNVQGDSWAYVVPGAQVDEVKKELDAIQATQFKNQETPRPDMVFISASSRASVTISGPPARLARILKVSEFFRDRKTIALPVYGGLCHAEHIYGKEHVSRVTEATSLHASFTPRVPVLSTSTGRPFSAKTASGLFYQIVAEILTGKIQWDNVINSVAQRARASAVSECQILTFRTSLPIHDLMDDLNKQPQDLKLKTSMKDVIQWIVKPETPSSGPRGPQQAKIAIVGMACRMPGGATDPEKFWKILEEGLDVHQKVPDDRFDVETHYDPTGHRVNTSHTPFGCFIDEPGLFDAPFFNMSPREACQTDPMQRLALVTAYEALEKAGYVANRSASTSLSRIGTFYGQASDDYREVACNSLWNGDTDMAVAGGMNVLTNSDAFAGLSKGHFLSKTPNACKTWDAEADGYCRADGVVSFVLKRLEDAEADNDNILGVILSAGTNHSAEAVSITHPHAGHQADLTREILAQASVSPFDVDYVELHGTGTQAGDGQEMKSVTDVFAPLNGDKRRSSKHPLHIGAVKANVGHGEAVAGPTALLKVLLMFQKEAIPPHVGIKNSLNPNLPQDLDRRHVRIPFEKTPWLQNSIRSRIAVVNNFSAAGGNSSIVIQEGAHAGGIKMAAGKKDTADPRSNHVIAVSAKSKASFRGNIQRLLDYLEEHPNVSLANLSYTTMARRYHHNHRVAISTPGDGVAQLKKHLSSTLQSADSHKPISPTGPPPIVFAFTGQAASHRSMSLELFRDVPSFRTHLQYLDSLSQSQGFPSFIPVLDGSYPQDHTHPPTVTQLALVCMEIALARYWESLGVRPDVIVGHSLGEYAAFHVAGVLSAVDTIFLAGRRAMMIEEKCQRGSHKMLAVRASVNSIREAVGDMPFEVACINSPQDTVLSGPVDDINNLAEKLQSSASFKSSHLDAAYAFHSEQMDPILDEFEDIATTGVLFQTPRLPVISPLLGRVIFDDKTINAKYMRRATRETVDFLGAIQKAQQISTVDETMLWVEIGPHPVCVGLARSILTAAPVMVPSLRRGESNWQTMSQSLAAVHNAGITVDWREYHRPFESGLRLLDLPSYAWNEKNHWIQYNGDWALTKGNNFYDAEKEAARAKNTVLTPTASLHELRTSLVHHVVDETFSESAGRVVVQSDMMAADFLAAAWGHKMNGAGVVTSSIHADIAFTLGKYLIQKLRPGFKTVADMDVRDLVVREGLVAQKNTRVPQLVQISISTQNVDAGVAHLEWHNLTNHGAIVDDEPIVTAQLAYGSNSGAYLASWTPVQHLVQGRIEALEKLVEEGVASRMSRSMAYLLFSTNLVDYADKYRGMQSVILHELEACAEVTLTTSDKSGLWTVPPFFIDSLFHIAGFVMNVSDAIDTQANFCVTPGWSSLRLARPLVAGASYRTYVKMIPTTEDPAIYLGHVYVLDGEKVVGCMEAIKFRRYPRILLNRFFSAPDVKNTSAGKPSKGTTASAAGAIPAAKPASVSPAEPTAVSVTAPVPAFQTKNEVKPEPLAQSTQPPPPPAPVAAPPAVGNEVDSTTAKAMVLLAAEAGLEPSELQDDASFANLGVDSLMSLVIAEKLRDQLGVAVSSSLFLEYPTVGDLRAWLLEYYS